MISGAVTESTSSEGSAKGPRGVLKGPEGSAKGPRGVLKGTPSKKVILHQNTVTKTPTDFSKSESKSDLFVLTGKAQQAKDFYKYLRILGSSFTPIILNY